MAKSKSRPEPHWNAVVGPNRSMHKWMLPNLNNLEWCYKKEWTNYLLFFQLCNFRIERGCAFFFTWLYLPINILLCRENVLCQQLQLSHRSWKSQHSLQLLRSIHGYKCSQIAPGIQPRCLPLFRSLRPVGPYDPCHCLSKRRPKERWEHKQWP